MSGGDLSDVHVFVVVLGSAMEEFKMQWIKKKLLLHINNTCYLLLEGVLFYVLDVIFKPRRRPTHVVLI